MKIIFLPSWVATKDSAAPEGGSEISIEKLETQLNTLKTMFAEKQKLVSDLEAYGPEGGFFFKKSISIVKDPFIVVTSRAHYMV